jgi:hypothetical protein
LVLKAQQPFRVLSIKSDEFEIQHGELSDQPKAFHTLPIQLRTRPKDGYGESKGKILVETDFPAKPALSIDVIYRLKTPATASTGLFNPLRDSADPGTSSDVAPAIEKLIDTPFR